MLPEDIIRLRHMLDAAKKAVEFTKGKKEIDMVKDEQLSLAIVRNLEVIGEAVKHIPQEIRDSKPEIEWRKIGALRDILAHEYFGVDLEIIWDVISNKLPSLKQEVKKLL